MWNVVRIVMFAGVLFLLNGASIAKTKPESKSTTHKTTPAERATDANRVLREIMQVPDQRIPDSLLKGADGIAVIPNVIKLGFVVSGRAGKGLISVRGADGTWSTPAFIKLRGGSVGFQAGAQATDVILVFRTKRSVENIVHGQFTLGADASIAAGPVGRQASADTDAKLKAEIYSYSRSRGLFAGVAFDGAVLSIDNEANDIAFGRGARAREILENRLQAKIDGVIELRDQLEEYTAGK